MEKTQSRIILLVAILQFVPLVLFPWSLSLRSLVSVVVLGFVCAFLAWALLRRKPWGRTLTIFVQGFNIIIRLLTVFSNVYKPDVGLRVALLGTYLASVALSAVVLVYIDRPDIQLIYQS